MIWPIDMVTSHGFASDDPAGWKNAAIAGLLTKAEPKNLL
jgi:hypothetical protein